MQVCGSEMKESQIRSLLWKCQTLQKLFGPKQDALSGFRLELDLIQNIIRDDTSVTVAMKGQRCRYISSLFSNYKHYCKKISQFRMICKDNSGYITQLKQQKSKRWYYLAAHCHIGNVVTNNITFLIFAVLVVWCRHCHHYKPFLTMATFRYCVTLQSHGWACW